jgi:hypothetical protein
VAAFEWIADCGALSVFGHDELVFELTGHPLAFKIPATSDSGANRQFLNGSTKGLRLLVRMLQCDAR